MLLTDSLGQHLQFATPAGVEANMDPMSDSTLWFLPHLSEKTHEKELLEKMKAEKNFGHPRRFSSITDTDLDKYVGVLLPGGAVFPSLRVLPPWYFIAIFNGGGAKWRESFVS